VAERTLELRLIKFPWVGAASHQVGLRRSVAQSDSDVRAATHAYIDALAERRLISAEAHLVVKQLINCS
jgi:hypothetical protein